MPEQSSTTTTPDFPPSSASLTVGRPATGGAFDDIVTVSAVDSSSAYSPRHSAKQVQVQGGPAWLYADESIVVLNWRRDGVSFQIDAAGGLRDQVTRVAQGVTAAGGSSALRADSLPAGYALIAMLASQSEDVHSRHLVGRFGKPPPASARVGLLSRAQDVDPRALLTGVSRVQPTAVRGLDGWRAVGADGNLIAFAWRERGAAISVQCLGCTEREVDHFVENVELS